LEVVQDRTDDTQDQVSQQSQHQEAPAEDLISQNSLNEEDFIIQELKRIAKSCQSKQSRPSMTMIREDLEKLAQKLVSTKIREAAS